MFIFIPILQDTLHFELLCLFFHVIWQELLDLFFKKLVLLLDRWQVKAYENLPTNGMVGEVHCFDPGEKNQVVLNNLERVRIEFDLVC